MDRKYAIKHTGFDDSYFRRWSALGPEFGPLTHASRFDSRHDASLCMLGNSVAFDECKIIRVGRRTK